MELMMRSASYRSSLPVSSRAKDEAAVIRHCAYCIQLCGIAVKLCAGCKKRAYCSRECQVKDWSSKGDGQRHVNWCRRYECGEEDVDWEVVPIPNKGLGIRAKKLIPAGLKIIIEPTFSSPNGHLGIMDLEGATLEDKFFNNCFEGDNMGLLGVALRIARVNHACQPNASSIYDETARAAILFAQKDIQVGEEITICYYALFFGLDPYESCSFLGLMVPELNSTEEEMSFFRNLMASAHGFTCPSGCSCYDPTVLALVDEGRQYQSAVVELTNQNKIEEALAAGDKLLDIHRRLNVSWVSLGNTYYNLFRIAVAKTETLPSAKKYIQSAVEIFGNICPYSEKLTETFEKLFEHPESDPNYLMMDYISSF